jgi:hypothetical protein
LALNEWAAARNAATEAAVARRGDRDGVAEALVALRHAATVATIIMIS